MGSVTLDDATAAVMSVAMALIAVWLLATAMRFVDRRLGDTDREDQIVTEVPFVKGQVRVDLWIARRFRPLVVPLIILIGVLALVRSFL